MLSEYLMCEINTYALKHFIVRGKYMYIFAQII